MLDFVKKYASNTYSQNGEDGIIEECLRRIGRVYGLCVEFGAADGYYCSNTRALIKMGWNSLLYDINPTGLDVMKAEITPDNVNSLIPNCNVLSIDTDGNDYNIWMAYKGNPDIVIIEINSSFAPTVEHTTTEQGASYRTMVKLGITKGYTLLCHTGNLLFIRNDHAALFPEIAGSDPVEMWQLFFNTKWLV